MGDDLAVNIKEGQILEDGFLKLSLVHTYHSVSIVADRTISAYPLLCWVSIIESNEHLSLVHLRKILVQHCSFGMTDMEVTTRLGRESCDHLSLLCTLKTKSKRSCGLV